MTCPVWIRGSTPVPGRGYPSPSWGKAVLTGVPPERTWDQRLGSPRKEQGTRGWEWSWNQILGYSPPSPPQCGQTHTCENFTLPHPSDAVGDKQRTTNHHQEGIPPACANKGGIMFEICREKTSPYSLTIVSQTPVGLSVKNEKETFCQSNK